MFEAPSEYRTVHFNTERQYVLVPVEGDPKELASGLISDAKQLLGLLEQVLVEYEGKGEKKNAMLLPFTKDEIKEAMEFMDVSRDNEKFVWESLAGPIIYKDTAYSRHKEAPKWHLELMERLGMLNMLVTTARKKDAEFDDFRNMELTSRIVKGNASVGPGMMYGRTLRILMGYKAASGVCSGMDPAGYDGKSSTLTLARIVGHCMGGYCSGSLDWYDYLVDTWDSFCTSMGEELFDAIELVKSEIAMMESGEFFKDVKVIPPNMLNMVMFFSPNRW